MTTAASSALKPGTRVQRTLQVTRAAMDPESRVVELSFASEEPYDRWWGREILDVSSTSMRMGRLTSGAPLLWQHNADRQIGVVESVSVGTDRVARAKVRFSRSKAGEEVYQDVLDGIVRNVSVGYVIHDAVMTETDGDTETYRVTDWEPYEVSMVSVPADATVGVGRSAEDPRVSTPPAKPGTQAEGRTMSVATQEPAAPAAQPAAAAAPQAPAVATSMADVQRAERERARQIREIGATFARHGVDKLVDKAIDDGSTVEAFRSLAMNTIAAAQTQVPNELGLSKGDAQRFSVMRAIKAMVERDWRNAGHEKAISDAICKRAGIPEPVNGGFYVPAEVFRRDLTVGTPTAGGNLVGTNLQPQSFIDLLRARSVVARLGATPLTGLVGNVTIPRLTGAGTAYWLANEATAITEGDQTIGQLALSPKTVGAYTEVSRLLMLQSTPAVDNLVMDDLTRVIALAIDLAALQGSGSGGQPTGIANTPGIGSVTGTSLAYAGVVEFQTDVAAGNALVPNAAYVTTPTVAGLLMQRPRFSSTDTPLWTGSVLDGQLGGFTATTTTQITAGSMTFGDFSQVVLAEWGLFELAMNPYANFPAGITGIRAIQSVDVGIRQAAAFSRATSIT